MTKETKRSPQSVLQNQKQDEAFVQEEKPAPALRFSPYAWAKLLFLRDVNDAEVGGFGITEPDDLLLVTDVAIVKQRVSGMSVCFDDAAVADFFDSQVEAGRKPETFARIWVHTHPSNMPEPSRIDEETFERVFGGCDWAVMFIIDREGQTSARIRFNAGPGAQGKLPVSVDYSRDFPGSDRARWMVEYRAHVRVEDSLFAIGRNLMNCGCSGECGKCLKEIAKLDPEEQEHILAELEDDLEEEVFG